jgi:hypothetical protein
VTKNILKINLAPLANYIKIQPQIMPLARYAAVSLHTCYHDTAVSYTFTMLILLAPGLVKVASSNASLKVSLTEDKML